MHISGRLICGGMLAVGDDLGVTRLRQVRDDDPICGDGLVSSASQSSKVQLGKTLSQLINCDLHALTIKSG
jgi:hypothetical protein